jgi:hypothetical protein
MNSIKNLLVVFIVLFSSSSLYAQTYCESFSSVQLKEHYTANFLNKDMRGCFEIYFNEHKSDSSSIGAFSVELGNHITSITDANAAKISYATFTSIGNYRTTSKKLSNDTDEVLRTIRYEAIASSKKIDQDLANFRDIYNVDGIKAIKDNSNQINDDLESLRLKIKELKQANAEIRSVPTTLVNPDSISELQKNYSIDPVNKEKGKWQNLKNSNAIPFHTLKKIYKGNPVFGAKILEEIKYARYMEMGLLKSTPLPLLDQVQKYESKTNNYNAKYDFAKNSISANDQYLKEKKFVLTASYELRNIADQNVVQGDFNKANDSLDMATLALEITTSLPLAATGRGLYEFYSGKSLLTNRDLSQFERGASLGIALIDLMPAAWIAGGIRGAWLVGELGARLLERGLIKAGFEDAINIGVENAKQISEVFQVLLASGSAKLDSIKRVIEHKLFFKYLSEEAYLASGAFKNDIIDFEIQFSELANPSSELGPKLEQDIVNKIKHIDELAIKTPYGVAKQELTKEALVARVKVEEGEKLYRLGTRNLSQTGEGAQFWSLENPQSPDYASRYGIPKENISNANFIETATIKKDSPFITRISPPVGSNLGGGVEVVVPEGGVNIESHISH